MVWLVAQVWVWVLVALLLGVLAGWLLWARPLQRAARAREDGAQGLRPRGVRARDVGARAGGR